jgi:hypothetical protein
VLVAPSIAAFLLRHEKGWRRAQSAGHVDCMAPPQSGRRVARGPTRPVFAREGRSRAGPAPAPHAASQTALPRLSPLTVMVQTPRIRFPEADALAMCSYERARPPTMGPMKMKTASDQFLILLLTPLAPPHHIPARRFFSKKCGWPLCQFQPAPWPALRSPEQLWPATAAGQRTAAIGRGHPAGTRRRSNAVQPTSARQQQPRPAWM